MAAWTEVVSGTLVEPFQLEEAPLELYDPPGGVVAARYVKFTMKTFYGISGGALRYFEPQFENVPCKASSFPFPLSILTKTYTGTMPSPKYDPDSTAVAFANMPAYDPANVISPPEEVEGPGNFWATNDGMTGSFILDYGEDIAVEAVAVKNAYNFPAMYR